ncbi:prepilin-type N-terminal cleavage/methylation domain-containing protein [Opitutaceae bacterium TAV4]|nr:prepilin-type N-terminal cleavage/methylation domain-containing protein [Opitutaceae bacterium TAV4]RRK01587.1 prepilin-type N-terminal cleavage/methylation domain-containing protein [Opitutaceae bacterium TAV3]
MKHLIHRNKAFTLIELLTVIAIIGILAAIIIPTVGSVRTSAKKAKTKVQFSQLIQAYELFKQEYGFYPNIGERTDGKNYLNLNTLDNDDRLPTEVNPTKKLAGALTGKKPDGTALGTGDDYDGKKALCGNRKKLSFYSFATDDLLKDDDKYYYQDAFGNTEIFIMCDANGDGIIKKADDGTPLKVKAKEGGSGSGTGKDEFILTLSDTDTIRASIIIYSAGDKGKGVKSWE